MNLPTGSTVIKDPQASDWPKGIDWTDYLAQIGASETIASSTWAIAGPDSALTEASGSIVTGNKKTQTLLTGGTLGATYIVINSMTTISGVHDERSFSVKVEQQ